MIDPRVFTSSMLGAAAGTAAVILLGVAVFWIWLAI
jgi:hypothetical protein